MRGLNRRLFNRIVAGGIGTIVTRPLAAMLNDDKFDEASSVLASAAASGSRPRTEYNNFMAMKPFISSVYSPPFEASYETPIDVRLCMFGGMH